MKRSYLTPRSVAAMLIAVTVSCAFAQEAEKATADPQMANDVGSAPTAKSGSYEEILKRFDKNGDGKIDENEKVLAHDAIRQGVMERRKNALRFFDRFDRNHDGKLDDGEKTAMKGFLEKNEGRVRGDVREALLTRLSEPGELKPLELYDHLAVAGARAKAAKTTKLIQPTTTTTAK